MQLETVLYESPCGVLELVANADALTAILLPNQVQRGHGRRATDNAILKAAVRQLDTYFTGERRTFSVPLAPGGTEFQNQVWTALQQIPYGTTLSYTELARAIGRPRAVRAVGAANGQNPIPLVIPCHRLIGSRGALTGYAGGLEMKAELLAWEAENVSA